MASTSASSTRRSGSADDRLDPPECIGASGDRDDPGPELVGAGDQRAITHDELCRHLADRLGESGLLADEDRSAELGVRRQEIAFEVADRADADRLRTVPTDDDTDLAGLERLLDQAA